MTSFLFTIPGRPKTWQRTNHVVVNGRVNRTSDADQRKAKRRMRSAAREALPDDWPTDAEYAVTVLGVWPDRRFGDVDRLLSLAMDALEGVAYKTDRQVSHVMAHRRKGEEPKTVVMVEVME